METTIAGLTNFNLSIQQYDKEKVRTKLASYLYSATWLSCVLLNAAFLQLNDVKPRTLYSNKRIEENFFSKGI